ncbi:MAG: transglycosylase SLT domain-containing protein, partial [Muribaculaceae bacterium]|nr:transglycosylase SLT domain-containing protein [Muribaculaceae bacterium]
DNWGKRKETNEAIKSVYRKYFEISKESPFYDVSGNTFGLNLKKGDPLSPYDNLFKQYGPTYGFDWKLLAAIGFNESRFKSDIISWAGARGVMQLMPTTAKAMGINNIEIPENNIHAAARLLKKLDESLESKVPDDSERMKFVVASYNCGLGHVYDAIALAEKYGFNPKLWTGNVSEAALMKSRPQYYNDPVVKNGYFRGRETVDFVDRVMDVYQYYKELNNS